MREISEVRFSTGEAVENRELIERYVLDAVERLPASECCEYAAFMPLSREKIGSDAVWLTVAGDADAVVDRESETWDALVADGVASDWEVTEVTDEWYENAGERGGELLLRLHRVANRATRAAFEEFERPPAAVDAYPEEASKHPIGWWMLLTAVTGHQAYSFDDTAEAFLSGIRKTCEDVAERESSADAIRRVDDCIRSLEALRAELDD
jgi:hypothetical protein